MNTSILLSLGIIASSFNAINAHWLKLNVVFILVDDYGWADVSYIGSSFMKLQIFIVWHHMVFNSPTVMLLSLDHLAVAVF